MRYLNFESFGNGYEEISKDDFFSITHGDNDEEIVNWVDFTEQEVQLIKDLFRHDYIISGYEYRRNSDLKKVRSNGFLAVSDNYYFKPSDTSNWSCVIAWIVKRDDEWYYISHMERTTYYKCDQFSGAMEVLRKIESEKWK